MLLHPFLLTTNKLSPTDYPCSCKDHIGCYPNQSGSSKGNLLCLWQDNLLHVSIEFYSYQKPTTMPTADHGKGQQGSPPANRSKGQYDQRTSKRWDSMLTAASQVALDLQIFNI
jgi:hypothetical protein